MCVRAWEVIDRAQLSPIIATIELKKGREEGGQRWGAGRFASVRRDGAVRAPKPQNRNYLLGNTVTHHYFPLFVCFIR